MMENYTQFGIDTGVKDRLDTYKAINKEKILVHMQKKKRLVTNSDAIAYLLDGAEGDV
ncbi:hypothetical protein GOV11_04810 [Candidatus Woesearchaeota archaeon]|nr:hypothetical protein [Candidatus Woesearchaeota archaeon]